MLNLQEVQQPDNFKPDMAKHLLLQVAVVVFLTRSREQRPDSTQARHLTNNGRRGPIGLLATDANPAPAEQTAGTLHAPPSKTM